jgi:predicted nucleotidyltransferase component of viral defense system
MIPSDFIVEWRAHTRWATDEQVEQDLVLCRALVEIFEEPEIAKNLALRGGTALHKLHFSPARRYSEDIDLVQLEPAPIGPTIDRIRAKLDSWLGEPKRERGEGVRLIYRFESENPPVVRLRLKLETNTREHFAVRGTASRPFGVESRWWQGQTDVTTFAIEEVLATKLRALFQRKKGRDLFDLWVALEEGIDPATVVDIFQVYVKEGGHHITRALFEENLAGKVHQSAFTGDVPRLLPPGVAFDADAALRRVQRDMIARVPGEPWKGEPRTKAKGRLRSKKRDE